MKIYEFSDETVEQAKAALVLGFDIVEKYEHPIKRIGVRVRDVKRTCELDNAFFPELKMDDCVDLKYIVHHKEINEIYKKYYGKPLEENV